MLVSLVLIIGVAVIGFLGWHFGKGFFQPERHDLLYHTVRAEPLEITVVEKGGLEAADNRDIVCQVKARSAGGGPATSIKWVIDDGTHVYANRAEELRSKARGDWVWPHTGSLPGHARNGKPATKEELADPAIKAEFEKLRIWSDLLVELDRSVLEDQKISQMIVVNKSEADVIAAEAQKEIVESENTSNLSKAKLKRDIAKLDLEKFRQGEQLAQRADSEGKVEQLKDRAAWSRRMNAKGYVSFSQSESDRLALEKALNDFSVLTKFQFNRTEKQLSGELDEAEAEIKRVEIKNRAELKKAETDLKTKRGLLEQEKEKYRDIEDQIAHCSIFAPQDGMVVYYQSEQSSRGFGSSQSIIAQGEPVREGQKLIRLPNLERMLVNTKVHEAMVARVRPGMKVDVRIDAMPDRVMKGSVRTVATVAAQPDWRSSPDVKMYQTMIAIDEMVTSLKPGMNAEATIFVDAATKPGPTVPVQAVVGGPELGPKRLVYVKGPDGQPHEREITVGLNNEKMVEVRDGLKEGEEVVLNPKALLGDKAKTRQPADFEKKSNGEGGAKPATTAPGGTGAPVAPTAGAGGEGNPMGGGRPGGGRRGGPGGPGAGGPGAGGPAGGAPAAGGANMDDMRKRMEEFSNNMKKAAPQDRKKMLEQVPEQFRQATKDRFKQQGIEIPD